MKILSGRSSCKITFEGNDKYSGRILLLEGEGNLSGEFYVYKSLVHKMCWANSSAAGPARFTWVDEAIRDEVLSYVMEEAKKGGYSIILW